MKTMKSDWIFNYPNAKQILFSSDMIRSILNGHKHQTRRMTGLKKINKKPSDYNFIGYDQNTKSFEFRNINTKESVYVKCQYNSPDNILWVRESHVWIQSIHCHDLLEGSRTKNQFAYKASVHKDFMNYAKEQYGYKWTPSLHMKKIACRLILKVKEIRVERMHDISREDALAEGIRAFTKDNVLLKYGLNGWNWQMYSGSPAMRSSPISAFYELWESIYGIENSSIDPWVFVIEFEPIEIETYV